MEWVRQTGPPPGHESNNLATNTAFWIVVNFLQQIARYSQGGGVGQTNWPHIGAGNQTLYHKYCILTLVRSCIHHPSKGGSENLPPPPTELKGKHDTKQCYGGGGQINCPPPHTHHHAAINNLGHKAQQKTHNSVPNRPFLNNQSLPGQISLLSYYSPKLLNLNLVHSFQPIFS